VTDRALRSPGRIRRAASVASGMAAAALCIAALAQTHLHVQPALPDARTLVSLPEPMRIHALASMRDHLQALQAINDALARSTLDEAADLAERRLGMTSLDAHGAADLAPHLPQGMQDIGARMHRAASRFALTAQNAGVTGDVRPALGALGDVMQQCVACHAAYRFH
jgi:cytochrome c556